MDYWNNYDSIFIKDNNKHPTHQNSICIYFLYVDNDNEIIKIKKQNYNMQNSTLHKNQLMTIISKHCIFNDTTKYFFDKLMSYNVHCENADIENIHNDSHWEKYFNSDLKELSICNDAVINESLLIFHDINSLFVFYKEKPKSILKSKKINAAATKKVRFFGSQQPYTRKHK